MKKDWVVDLAVSLAVAGVLMCLCALAAHSLMLLTLGIVFMLAGVAVGFACV